MEKNILWGPEGKVCAFTGYRPAKMPFRSEDDPACLALKMRLKDEIYDAIADGCTDFLCGMALGTDTWAAEAVLAVRDALVGIRPIRLHAYVPFRGQDEHWSARSRKRYHQILSACDSVTVISEEYRPSCMEERNRAMVQRADTLVAVFDGKKGGTANTIRMAHEKGIRLRIISPIPPQGILPNAPVPTAPPEEKRVAEDQLTLFPPEDKP